MRLILTKVLFLLMSTKKAFRYLAFLLLINQTSFSQAPQPTGPGTVVTQPACPTPNFLSARSVALQPSANSHINVVRRPDGSYTGFESANGAPYRVIRTSPNFEQQFASCLPHTVPSLNTTSPPMENPPGAASQRQVSFTLPSGNYSVARVDTPTNGSAPTIHFDIFDPQLYLLTETNFTAPTPLTQVFFTLKLADVNGDGRLDLIAFSQTSLEHGNAEFGLWIFLGNGDGTFQAPLQQDMGTHVSAGSSTIAVGDLNGDGEPEIVLVVNSALGPFGFTFLGNGDGTFRQQNLPLGVPISSLNPVSLALADLNGDGKLDLVLTTARTNHFEAVGVELGNGDGAFQSPVLFPVRDGADDALVTLAIGDVNGDGIPDIVTSTGTILFGDGKGGFPSRRDYAVNGSGAAMLADFDGDGITDILIGGGNPVFLTGTVASSLTVLFGQGAGAFVAAPVSPAGISGTYFTTQSLASADFDGDGNPDLVLAEGSDDFVAILKGKGNGAFTSVYNVNLTNSGRFPVSVAVADFNRDGKPDVAVLMEVFPGTSGEVQVFFGNGDGTLTRPIVLPESSPSASSIAARDLNNDGIPDLVVSAQNTVSVWLGKPGGTFAAPVSYSVQGGYLANGYAVSLAFGDFNGDGKVDIAVPSQGGGNIALLLGKGDGTFSMGPVVPISLPAVPGRTGPRGPVNLAAADFNGDGRLDIAATLGDYENGVAILLGKGDGTFQAPILNPQPATDIVVADLNADKIPDLVVTGELFGTSVVLLGNGDGTFSPPQQLFSLPLRSLAVGDFDKDGLVDVAGGMISIGVGAFLNLTTVPPPLTVVPSSSFVPGPLAADSFATAFGRSLANQTVVPNLNPPPTSVAGVTVTVTDSTGVSRPAALFYISAGQINFLIPSATAPGPATVTVNSTTGKFSAQVEIVVVAPTLFTVGSGIAAAYITQVAPDGSQTTQFVFSTQSGGISPLPINLSAGVQVYLVLFGTGFDAATSGSVTATVQGVPVPMSYAGPQLQLPGLDQVNVLLPPLLAGEGISSVVLTIEGMSTNTVYITIQ